MKNCLAEDELAEKSEITKKGKTRRLWCPKAKEVPRCEWAEASSTEEMPKLGDIRKKAMDFLS